MVTTRRILCPTDFSPFAESALEQAIVLGRRYEAEIVSLHVIPTLVSSVRVEPPPQLDAEARQRVLAELERFTEPARGMSVARVQALVDAHTERAVLRFLGQDRVNVTELNLALARAGGTAVGR